MAGYTVDSGIDVHYMELDPKCPAVDRHDRLACFDDPMTDAMGAGEFVAQAESDWAKRHIAGCERCKRYAMDRFF